MQMQTYIEFANVVASVGAVAHDRVGGLQARRGNLHKAPKQIKRNVSLAQVSQAIANKRLRTLASALTKSMNTCDV
jgi:hypothetical protein